MAKKKIVEPLPRGLRVDGDEFDGPVRACLGPGISICGIWSGLGALLRTYNVFHQRGRVSA
ncbi:hypothetical protein ACSFA7_23430 [Variovorax sp. LT1R20]